LDALLNSPALKAQREMFEKMSADNAIQDAKLTKHLEDTESLVMTQQIQYLLILQLEVTFILTASERWMVSE
jgi:hypothetical protein